MVVVLVQRPDLLELRASGERIPEADPTANRGLDVWKPVGDLARKTRKAKRWAYSNPQTQEAWQAP